MEKKVQDTLEYINRKIGDREERLRVAVEEFKEAAARYDAYSIDTFIDGYVRRIHEERAELAKLADEKQMLEYLLREEK